MPYQQCQRTKGFIATQHKSTIPLQLVSSYPCTTV